MSLTLDRLKSVLAYDSETGIFTWLAKPRRRSMDLIAGTENGGGYRQICIYQKVYKAHRLAWFYVYGKWPSGQIDHINGMRSDNRISNLREATHSTNQANAKKRSSSNSPHKGVTYHVASGLWHARVTKERKLAFSGYFNSPDEAAKAYRDNSVVHFGEFARST